MKKIIMFIVAAPLISSILILTHVWVLMNQSYEGPKTKFTIQRGESFSSINYRLHKNEIINNPRLFHYYAKYKKSITKFKVGTYHINPGETIPDIVDKLVNGSPIMISVTIPEGKNMYEIGRILEKKGVTSYQTFIKIAKKTTLIDAFNIEGVDVGPKTVEGYLYPDTYRFIPNSPASLVIKTMVLLFKKKTNTLDFSSSKLSKHQVITLASIVEKETGAKAERPLISGVFHNRLKKRMRLQSDPTTIYGIFETFNGNLRKKHLLEKTPYNTYKISGLPLGPIANPGLEAITAVLNPESHNYYYFVSHNDGTHEFTSTYRDHLKAVDKYQKNRRNRKGKSWRDLRQ